MVGFDLTCNCKIMHIPKKRYRPQRFHVDNRRPVGLGTLECSALVFQLCQPTFQKASRVVTGSYPESVATECSACTGLTGTRG